MSREPMPDLAEAVARHQYGPHRCVGYFSEGNDRCIINRLQAEVDRLRPALETARLSLKGARGLALDTDATEFDIEFARTIDVIDAALYPVRAALDAKERDQG